ncbi:transporter substrate-binding domain-containing protein [Marinobacter daepoensis]|uniref:Transporter substrate-binding domain-containing protein n=1 Tax=Marinobacter daepoensis TaxID=262077 RepID=A0ABS3BJN6_9GAMM|nr:transporter substrate-binding domain-containing protein [Marinobacter daepoensis]MBN7770435.1 transporter substrate-binding domain-containing protein [Marinobacter daepoensis]MBY6033967.1 transporter substrate-binding domain-containing protein [Marinobacter daepoensis]MBY6079881.1 transporter substrate-binding domain-containing protein [Marinobacter daepoensis]
MRRLARVLALLLFTQIVIAQEVDDGDRLLNRPADRTYDIILESGYLKVGMYQDFPPYSYEVDGEPMGVDVALGRRIAQEMGVEFKVHWIVPDENLGDDLRNNVWKGHYLAKRRLADVMLRVPYDKTYAYMQDSTGEYINEQVVLFGPYQQETWQIAFDPARLDSVETVAVFQYNRIGVEIDTLPDFYLTSALAGRMREQVRHFKSVEDAFRAMRSGEVSAVMGMRSEIDHELAKAENSKFRAASNGFPGIGKQVWDVGLAIKHTHRQLGYALEAIVDKLVKSGEMNELMAGLNLRYSVPGYYRNFLDEEAIARAEGSR